MSRIVIVGAGAVGSVLAAQLEAAGVPHLLVGRGEHIRKVIADGLLVRSPAGERTAAVTAVDGIDAVEWHADDVLVIATKSQDVGPLLERIAWAPVAGAEPGRTASTLPVVTLQNGLAAERIALRWFPTVLGASILIPAKFLEPGEVVVAAAPKVGVLTLGRYPSGESPVAERVAETLRRAELVVQVTSDVVRWKAAKLPVSAKNVVEVLGGDAERKSELASGLAAEAEAALRGAGIALADRKAERTEDVSGYVVQRGELIVPGQQSTWQSFARGAGSHEADYLTGEVVLLGRLHGVPVPLSEAVQRVLGRSGRAQEAPGTRDVAEVWDAVRRPAGSVG